MRRKRTAHRRYALPVFPTEFIQLEVLMFKQLVFSLPLFLLLFSATPASSHCEIPCGIYDDHMRIHLLEEHVTTMEKSMKKIVELKDAGNGNQHVRWIMNKEAHADKFQEIVSQYFLTQRITMDQKQYPEKLQALHQMLVYAMKCKQTTDLQHIAKLKELVQSFSELYFTSDN
jgi:nickel superoxide dismutase